MILCHGAQWRNTNSIISNPVIQLIDNKTSEILYTVRIEGNSFAPRAPIDREFTIKAGKDSPDNVIQANARAKK